MPSDFQFFFKNSQKDSSGGGCVAVIQQNPEASLGRLLIKIRQY